MSKILSVKDLTKWYGKILAVDHLNFELEKGKVVGLLGPNGSGKTTTLATLLGIIKTYSGSFQWFNETHQENANKRIGSLIEIPYFYPYLNLRKNLEIVAKVRGKGFNQIEEILDKVGLASRIKSPFYTLSLGMKQRLALGSALLGDPEVLVLDEPTNGLDPEGIAEVRNLIIEQSKLGKTILLASHILDEVEKVCTDVIILKNGKSIGGGAVKDLINSKQTVTLGAENMSELAEALTSIHNIRIISKENDTITIALNENTSTAMVNKVLAEKGIVLNKLEISKSTLESQFLEIVKRNLQE